MNTLILKSIPFAAKLPAIFDGIRDEAATGNSSDALTPEAWVREALVQVSEKRVASHLVFTDYSAEVARFGQIIHTHRPARMTSTRKKDGQALKTSTANVDNVDIVLNQWITQSFIIYDAENSLSFKDLVSMHLIPAAESIAQQIDQLVCNQVYQFVGKSESGDLNSPVSKPTIINTRRNLIKNKVDPAGMNFLVGPDSEAQILSIDALTKVNEAGDAGRALRNAIIGRLFGFIFFMTHNTPSVPEMTGASTDLSINNTGGYPAGATDITVDLGASATALVPGQWIMVGGTPRRIASVSAPAVNDQDIVLTQGLRASVADASAVSAYECQDTGASPFPADYIDDIAVAGTFADDVALGQLVSFGTVDGVYGTIASPDEVLVLGASTPYQANKHFTLDVPVQNQIPAATAACLGPEGNYNFAFHRNAVALVSRPPAPPQAGMGVRSFSTAYEGMALRATLTYDGVLQGTRVTLDTFVGVKTMDERYGAVCYANND
jgi:hypothetical protein